MVLGLVVSLFCSSVVNAKRVSEKHIMEIGVTQRGSTIAEKNITVNSTGQHMLMRDAEWCTAIENYLKRGTYNEGIDNIRPSDHPFQVRGYKASSPEGLCQEPLHIIGRVNETNIANQWTGNLALKFRDVNACKVIKKGLEVTSYRRVSFEGEWKSNTEGYISSTMEKTLGLSFLPRIERTTDIKYMRGMFGPNLWLDFGADYSQGLFFERVHNDPDYADKKYGLKFPDHDFAGYFVGAGKEPEHGPLGPIKLATLSTRYAEYIYQQINDFYKVDEDKKLQTTTPRGRALTPEPLMMALRSACDKETDRPEIAQQKEKRLATLEAGKGVTFSMFLWGSPAPNPEIYSVVIQAGIEFGKDLGESCGICLYF